MTRVLIDANYYGSIMRDARRHLKISSVDAAGDFLSPAHTI